LGGPAGRGGNNKKHIKKEYRINKKINIKTHNNKKIKNHYLERRGFPGSGDPQRVCG